MKQGVECNSDDERLRVNVSIGECANACKEKEGCNFFRFGTGIKAGKCYWEKTPKATCPEGWQDNDYNFYIVKGMLHQLCVILCNLFILCFVVQSDLNIII